MVNVYDVPADMLITAVKEELKKNDKIKQPEWATFVKSGAHKERPPQQDDFWQIRGAALLRKVYTKGPIGVSRLRTEYGGKKNRGAKPEEHRKGSGKIIRELFKQLGEAGYVKQGKKGRVITSAGQKFLDNIAHEVSKTLDFEKLPTEEKERILRGEKKEKMKEKARKLMEKMPEKTRLRIEKEPKRKKSRGGSGVPEQKPDAEAQAQKPGEAPKESSKTEASEEEQKPDKAPEQKSEKLSKQSPKTEPPKLDKPKEASEKSD